MTKLVRETFEYETVMLSGDCNAGLGHRLDKETSGCVLVGKTYDAWQHIRQQFHNNVHSVYKEYYCLTYGVTPLKGTVDAFIRKADFTNAPNATSAIVQQHEEGAEDSYTAYE